MDVKPQGVQGWTNPGIFVLWNIHTNTNGPLHWKLPVSHAQRSNQILPEVNPMDSSKVLALVTRIWPANIKIITEISTGLASWPRIRPQRSWQLVDDQILSLSVGYNTKLWVITSYSTFGPFASWVVAAASRLLKLSRPPPTTKRRPQMWRRRRKKKTTLPKTPYRYREMLTIPVNRSMRYWHQDLTFLPHWFGIFVTVVSLYLSN